MKSCTLGLTIRARNHGSLNRSPVFAFAGLGGFLLVNTLYLQNVRGYSPLLAGVFTLPMAAMTALFSPLSGRLVASRGARPRLDVGAHRELLRGLGRGADLAGGLRVAPR